MRHLHLVEGAPPIAFDLADGEAEALAGADLAAISRIPGGNAWEVAAGSKVGAIQVGGDLQVTITPKIDVARLIFLMGYARAPSYWRDHSVLLDPDLELVDALAESFQRLALKAVEQGLLHGYVSVDDSLPVLRGRIRVADQIGRRWGIGIPLEVRYDEFTVDIAENQLLLTAALCLLRLPNVSGRARTSLQRLRLLLSDVSQTPRGAPLPQWQASRLNAQYVPALRLAELILAGDSFEQRQGDLAVNGFVVDMWRVFEDFVCVALGEAMGSAPGHATLQYRTHLDLDKSIPMRPDFVWVSEGLPVVVVDAKYKAEKPAGFPQADLYQLLAYCTVMGLSNGHLIYAKGNEIPAVHKVRSSPVRIQCHSLDLTAPAVDLLTAVDAVGGLILSEAQTRAPAGRLAASLEGIPRS